jgi:2-dehydro-3-deoxyphosphogluconate aldolase/(4S)-4-hydroxy-2-oxoglutarate aldolase
MFSAGSHGQKRGSMSTVLTEIARTRIIAIVRLAHYNRALEVAQALIAGGITTIEFTLTGSGALHAIAQTRAALGDSAVIGAGTVLTVEDVGAVAGAGAQFIVTPYMSPVVIENSHAHTIPIICGALTPTEMMQAHEAGADMIKVFPARQVGPQYVRDVLAPLPHLRLVPTGGVTAQNASAYLQAGSVAVGIGGNLVSEQAVSAGAWEQITRLARECVESTRT